MIPLVLAAACGSRRDVAPSVLDEDDAAAASAADQALAEDAVPAPMPTLRGLDAAALDELAAVEVDGYEVAARDRTERSLVVALRAGARLRALVTAGPCLRCRTMEAADWQGELPALRALLPGSLEDDPGTAFELTATTIGEHACIATWELGAMAFGDELVATHAARLYCQDAYTELVIRVDDDAVTRAKDPEAARRGAVRAAVEGAARDLATAYLARLAP